MSVENDSESSWGKSREVVPDVALRAAGAMKDGFAVSGLAADIILVMFLVFGSGGSLFTGASAVVLLVAALLFILGHGIHAYRLVDWAKPRVRAKVSAGIARLGSMRSE